MHLGQLMGFPGRGAAAAVTGGIQISLDVRLCAAGYPGESSEDPREKDTCLGRLSAMKTLAPLVAALGAAGSAAAVTIAQINGNRFLSPFRDQTANNVTGLVTAVSKTGIYLRSTEPDDDPATGEGLFVFSSAVANKAKVGDVVSMDGVVREYRCGSRRMGVDAVTVRLMCAGRARTTST